MKSVWCETELPKYEKLKGNINTDVLIIGGGMAGILTAYFLNKNGIDCVVVEKDRICGENTGNTTAKITVQHGLIYNKLIDQNGLYTARKYLDANLMAADRFKEMCRNIDCDYEVKDSYVYSRYRSKLEREMRAVKAIHYPADFCEKIGLPVKSAGAVRFINQAQFNPIKFVSGIIKNIKIYENTFVREMVGNTAVTDSGRIKAKKTVCATHFPFINKHGSYFMKLYQERSYVIALENAPDVDGMYVDDSKTGLSFRNYNGLLLIGGGGGRTGNRNKSWDYLRDFSRQNYPYAREKYFWAAQDCMSLDSIPYIGQYSKNTPDFYVETGFNKWGMTGSMLSAIIISDIIAGRKNEFSDIFSPSRSIIKPQLFVNGYETVKNLLTPSKKVCPHLGCALKWNGSEHSWDCPCHGSRFSNDGEVLNNPANGNLKK